jgi:lipopolysaccharide transport system permease protein
MASVASRPAFFAALPRLFTSGLAHSFLIRQLTVREIMTRYRGSWLGMIWSFVNPLIMLAVYTFVFGTVFQVKWGVRTDDGTAGFAIVLFAGLIVHGIFAECVTRAPMLIVTNASYVKRVVFPLEVLPYVALATALFHGGISLLVLIIFQAATMGVPSATIFLLPLVWAPFALLTLGLTYFLASLGVYLRDIGQVMQPLVTILLFLSPVFFPVDTLPESLRPLIRLNPLTFIIEQTREVLLWGRLPDWTGLALYALLGLAVAWLGYYWFQRTRRGFADVL